MPNSLIKIFFVAPSAYPLGGVAVWLDYLLPGLEAGGWQVTLGLVSGSYHDVDAYCRVYPRLQHVVAIDNPTGSRRGRINNLAGTFLYHAPDLIIGVNIPDVFDAVNIIRSNNKDAPHVAMAIHGIQPDLLDDVAAYRLVLDGVICTNRLTGRLAGVDAGMERSRILYAPYGVDQVREESVPQQVRGKLRIAWVGRLEQEQKRIFDLVQIIDQLACKGMEFEILIAGNGPEEQNLRKKLEQRQLLSYVCFLGMIAPEKMQELVYAHCDVLLVTSYWETGPIIIWEAMASGIPVVSSRYIGSGLEMGLIDGKNCLLYDIGDCVAAVAQLAKLREPGLRACLSAGGRGLVKTRYNRKLSIQAWDTAFQAILSLPVRGAVPLGFILPSGRLDRLLGVRKGEYIRRLLGISHTHAAAGGEWPHSYGPRKHDDSCFWQKAGQEDTIISS